MPFRRKPAIPSRRGLTFQELLKRRETIAKSVVLPKKRFFPSREGGFFDGFPRLSKGIKRFAFLFLAVSLSVLFLYLLFFSSLLKVEKIRYFHGREEVKTPPFTLPFAELEKKHFFLIAPSEIIQKILQNHYAEIASVRLNRRIPSTLVIRYETYPEIANVVVTKEGLQRTFLINERGFVVGQDNENSKLPFISGPFEDFPKIGSQLILEDHAKAISRANKIFTEKFGLKVPLIIYKKAEREAHLKTEKDFFVWLDLTQDVERQLFKLKRSLPKIDIYNEHLSYIDLRISGKTGEKVIFKRRF